MSDGGRSPAILYCGSRDLTDSHTRYLIRQHMIRNEPQFVIVGGARGVDTLAEQAARGLGIHHAVVPALWKSYGKSAGFKRNTWMLELLASIDPVNGMVVGYPLKNGSSRGTEMMLSIAERAGVLTERYPQIGADRQTPNQED